MVKRKVTKRKSTARKCEFGKLASPVRNPGTGSIRRCKLKPASKRSTASISADMKKKSSQFHERRYQKNKRSLARTVKKTERKMARRISSRTTRKKKK